MHDAHVHLDFMANGKQVAADAAAVGTLLFANTVTPGGFVSARARFDTCENVSVGWGMHPWWVDAQAELSLPPIPAETRFVGEVGLDFGTRHAASRDIQIRVFERIARQCAEQGGKVLSIHSVRAAREVLDMLESCGTLETCTCVFHWYTGPSDQLKRAIDAGCLFSVGPRMLATSKGREYVKAIPPSRLLLETDAPPGEDVEYSYAELHADLERVGNAFFAIKGAPILETVDTTFRALFAEEDGALNTER